MKDKLLELEEWINQTMENHWWLQMNRAKNEERFDEASMWQFMLKAGEIILDKIKEIQDGK